jgi:hypothetical protein
MWRVLIHRYRFDWIEDVGCRIKEHRTHQIAPYRFDKLSYLDHRITIGRCLREKRGTHQRVRVPANIPARSGQGTNVADVLEPSGACGGVYGVRLIEGSSVMCSSSSIASRGEGEG